MNPGLFGLWMHFLNSCRRTHDYHLGLFSSRPFQVRVWTSYFASRISLIMWHFSVGRQERERVMGGSEWWTWNSLGQAKAVPGLLRQVSGYSFQLSIAELRDLQVRRPHRIPSQYFPGTWLRSPHGSEQANRWATVACLALFCVVFTCSFSWTCPPKCTCLVPYGRTHTGPSSTGGFRSVLSEV